MGREYKKPKQGEVRSVIVSAEVPLIFEGNGWNLDEPPLALAMLLEERAVCMAEDQWDRENGGDHDEG